MRPDGCWNEARARDLRTVARLECPNATQTAAGHAPVAPPRPMIPPTTRRLLEHELSRLERLAIRHESGEEHAPERCSVLVEPVPVGAEHAGCRLLVDQRAHRASL